MTIKLIAAAAGLSADAEESAVVAAVSQLHAFVGEIKTLTKAQSADGVLGAIRGLQATAEQAQTLQAKVAEQAQQLEAQERASIIAADKADPKGRKLTPALEAWAQTQPLDGLKAFLAAAPHVLQMAQNTQQTQPAVQPTTASQTAPEPLAHNGKTWEQMSFTEKHNLKVEDPQAYADLQRNHVERGQPRAQSQQQRASA